MWWSVCGRADRPNISVGTAGTNQVPLAEIIVVSVRFPTQEFGNAGRAINSSAWSTNRLTMPGNAVIRWHRERFAGMSEKAHAVMKDDLAGGKMPSAHFGVKRVVDDHDHRDEPPPLRALMHDAIRRKPRERQPGDSKSRFPSA
jgi:hypothetical protein